MGNWPLSRVSGPLGLDVPLQKIRVMNRGGATTVPRGSLMQFDLDSGDAASTDYAIGSSNSVFANVINPATAGLSFSWFCVSFSDMAGDTSAAIADNVEYVAVLRGIVPALVEGTIAAALVDYLKATNGNRELNSDTAGLNEKILGKPLETTAAATAELIDIIFNGIEGFGQGA